MHIFVFSENCSLMPLYRISAIYWLEKTI